MFKHHRITDNWESRVDSTYRAPMALNAGAIVQVDPTDTTAVSGSVGFSSMINGSLKLATIGINDEPELGFSVMSVISGGVPLFEKILGLATNYMSVPAGLNPPVYKPVPGDVIGTTEYVGYLASDVGQPGFLDTTNTANLGTPMKIVNGRFAVGVPGTDRIRAYYDGNTSANGAAIALFRMA